MRGGFDRTGCAVFFVGGTSGTNPGIAKAFAWAGARGASPAGGRTRSRPPARNSAAKAAWGAAGIRADSVVPEPIAGMESMSHLGPNPSALANIADSVPLRRLGTPDDIADLCLFGAPSVAVHATGAVLLADGGWTRWALGSACEARLAGRGPSSCPARCQRANASADPAVPPHLGPAAEFSPAPRRPARRAREAGEY